MQQHEGRSDRVVTEIVRGSDGVVRLVLGRRRERSTGLSLLGALAFAMTLWAVVIWTAVEVLT